jgi:hypothetical protein
MGIGSNIRILECMDDSSAAYPVIEICDLHSPLQTFATGDRPAAMW